MSGGALEAHVTIRMSRGSIGLHPDAELRGVYRGVCQAVARPDFGCIRAGE
jgi:hypothetical protein